MIPRSRLHRLYRLSRAPLRRRTKKGFTLLEILLVLGILGVLAAIVLIAVNPTKQLGDARSAHRTSSVREIENAMVQYIIDGNDLPGIPAVKAQARDICRDTITGLACTDAPVSGYDLDVLTPTYIVNIPIDPDETDTNITGYRIYQQGSFVKICSVREEDDCGA
jgi:type IV pilus assembly protein PilA